MLETFANIQLKTVLSPFKHVLNVISENFLHY